MAFIEYVVIHIDGKKFELSKEQVRKLYNELYELLHEKPVQFPPVCPQPYTHPRCVVPRIGDY